MKKVQAKDGKWNLQNNYGEYISDVWFDNLEIWSSYSASGENPHDIYGWDGLIFLEEPIKTEKSAYPYSVKAKVYHYSSEGELLSVTKDYCGLSGL